MASATLNKGKGRPRQPLQGKQQKVVVPPSTALPRTNIELYFQFQDVRAPHHQSHADPTGYWNPGRSATLHPSWFNDRWWRYNGTGIRLMPPDFAAPRGLRYVRTLHHSQGRFYLSNEHPDPLYHPDRSIFTPDVRREERLESRDLGLRAIYFEDIDIDNVAQRHTHISCGGSGGASGGQTHFRALVPRQNVLEWLFPKSYHPMPERHVRNHEPPRRAGLCGNAGLILALISHSIWPAHMQEVLEALVSVRPHGGGSYWSLEHESGDRFGKWVNGRGVVVTLVAGEHVTEGDITAYEADPRNLFPVPPPASNTA